MLRSGSTPPAEAPMTMMSRHAISMNKQGSSQNRGPKPRTVAPRVSGSTVSDGPSGGGANGIASSHVSSAPDRAGPLDSRRRASRRLRGHSSLSALRGSAGGTRVRAEGRNTSGDAAPFSGSSGPAEGNSGDSGGRSSSPGREARGYHALGSEADSRVRREPPAEAFGPDRGSENLQARYRGPRFSRYR